MHTFRGALEHANAADLKGSFASRSAGGWKSALAAEAGLPAAIAIAPISHIRVDVGLLRDMVMAAQTSVAPLLYPKPDFFVEAFGGANQVCGELWRVLPIGKPLLDATHFFVGNAKRAEESTDALRESMFRYAKFTDSDWLTMPVFCLVLQDALGAAGAVRLVEVNAIRTVRLQILDLHKLEESFATPQDSDFRRLSDFERQLVVEINDGVFVEAIDGRTVRLDTSRASVEARDADSMLHAMYQAAAAIGKGRDFAECICSAASAMYAVLCDAQPRDSASDNASGASVCGNSDSASGASGASVAPATATVPSDSVNSVSDVSSAGDNSSASSTAPTYATAL